MDAEQTLMRVQERLTRMLRPTVRASLEYLFLFFAITLFCLLVVLHANYVQQPGCSSELSVIESMDAQIYHIKITSAGLWSQNHTLESSSSVDTNNDDNHDYDYGDTPTVVNNVPHPLEPATAHQDYAFTPPPSNLCFDSGPADTHHHHPEQCRDHPNAHQDDHLISNSYIRDEDEEEEDKEEEEEVKKEKQKEQQLHNSFVSSAKETFKAALVHFGNKWHRRILFIWRHSTHLLASFWKLWLQMQTVAGIHLNLDILKFLRVLHLDRVNSYAVQWLENGSKTFEPTYLYTMEKGYFLLPEGAKTRHGIRTVNISISARHSCFGNRWQQLIINRFVGYDTILINSLLTRPGQGYLYNYQSNEFYNLSHAHEPPEGPGKFGDYLVIKCGVLMMSLFVFFTTTMSVSFTLRETQTRMLKFTVQLQHHARHRLPTFQLIFVHVVESLVFVPIMIGILFFLFEFYDDQLLAFMVLILVWLCELFTLISVRTPISMKFFPRFFLLYFLVFHIYFFSYAYGFSYVALSTTAAFMQHLILYFWNRFEVPALQRFMQNRRSQLQQHPDFHITSSTILASTLHITRLNTRPPNPTNTSQTANAGLRFGDQAMQVNRPAEEPGQQYHPGQAGPQQGETGPNPGGMNSISSLLLWILGGASSEGLTSFLSMFRDVRDQGQDFAESPRHRSISRNENRDPQDVQ